MEKQRRAFYLTTLFVLLICSSVVHAQDNFMSKHYTEWSKSEANKVLNDSPWVKAQEVRIPQGGANAPLDFRYTLRLRSALPIRQALVRLRQLDAKYDKMSAADKAAFDAKVKGLLDCPACADNYVVTISSKSESYPNADAIFDVLKTATTPALQKYVYLANELDERRMLVHFTAPKAAGGEAMFFFPRLDEKGQPLLSPASKKLLFRMSDRNVGASTNFEFDVSKIVINSNVEF